MTRVRCLALTALFASMSFMACSAERPQEPPNYSDDDYERRRAARFRNARSYGEVPSAWQPEEELISDDQAAPAAPAPTPAPVPAPTARPRAHRSHRPRIMCDTLPVPARSAITCWTMGCEEPFPEPATRTASCDELRRYRLPRGRYRCRQDGRSASVTFQ